MSAGDTSPLELQLIPKSSDYRENDARWLNQVAILLNDLQREVGEVRKEITPVPGQKGGTEAIILALGTSGAITAAVSVFRAWLARSADRAVTIKGKADGRAFDLEITGRNITEGTLRQALGIVQE